MKDTTNAVERMAVQAALTKMLRGPYFDICTVRMIAEKLGRVEGNRAFKTLSVLHCVHYADMPDELRNELPTLIVEALSLDPIEFDLFTPRRGPEPLKPRLMIVDAAPSPAEKKPGLMRRLGFGGAK